MTLKSLFAAAAIFAATTLPASSDSGLIAQFGPSGAGKTTVIRVLMASLAPKSLSINAGQDGAVFADFGNRKIFIVDEKNKSVIDMGAMAEQYRASGFAKPKSGDLDQLNAAQDVLHKQIEDMLAKMPESQRDIARKALEKQFGLKPKEKKKPAAGAPVMSIEETGETRVNDGREERLVRILVGGTPSSEVWITDPENLDGGPEFMQALSELQDLFQDLAGDFMTDGQIGVGDTDIFLGGLPNLDGFQVDYHDLDTGETDRLDYLAWKDIDPEAFAPPKGYRVRTILP